MDDDMLRPDDPATDAGLDGPASAPPTDAVGAAGLDASAWLPPTDGVTANVGVSDGVVPPLPTLPDEITANAEEVRRLIDAGASSPEELRALAARIREHRALEESLWRSEVKPALIQAKKSKFTLRDLRDPVEDQHETANSLKLGLGILVVVAALVLAATQSSFLWILVPVVGVLVVAYRQGRDEHRPSDDGPPPPGEPPA